MWWEAGGLPQALKMQLAQGDNVKREDYERSQVLTDRITEVQCQWFYIRM